MENVYWSIVLNTLDFIIDQNDGDQIIIDFLELFWTRQA